MRISKMRTLFGIGFTFCQTASVLCDCCIWLSFSIWRQSIAIYKNAYNKYSQFIGGFEHKTRKRFSQHLSSVSHAAIAAAAYICCCRCDPLSISFFRFVSYIFFFFFFFWCLLTLKLCAFCQFASYWFLYTQNKHGEKRNHERQWWRWKRLLQVTVFLSYFLSFSTFFFFLFVFIITNLLWLLISFTFAFSFLSVRSSLLMLVFPTIYVRVLFACVEGEGGGLGAVNMDYFCDLLLLAFCWFKSLLIVANGTNEIHGDSVYG